MIKVEVDYNGYPFTLRFNPETELFSVSDMDKVATELFGFAPRKSNDWMKTKKFKTKRDALEMNVVTQIGGKYDTRGVWVDLSGMMDYCKYVNLQLYMIMFASLHKFMEGYYMED